jgi:hypothetical protein
MKIYSLYYEGETFVAAFPTRKDAIEYGKQHYGGWECDVIEEYSSRINNPFGSFGIPQTNLDE